MVDGKRTGRVKQYYEEGSLFDGYMLEDQLVQGKFYFASGDFFEGTFENNQLKNGTYIKVESKLECTGATFEDNLLNGTPLSLTWETSNQNKCSFKGSFKAGKPHG